MDAEAEDRAPRGQQDGEAARTPIVEIGAREPIGSLLAAAPTAGDERCQIAVSGAIGGEQHDARRERVRAAFALRENGSAQCELCTDDQRKPRLLGGNVRAHDAREGAFVSERERGVAQGMRRRHQLFRMRSTVQEREIA